MATAIFDINNFVIERAVRGTMVSPSTGDINWTISQIEDPSLKVTSDKNEVLDAMGSTIMSFNKAKKAEFTASNSLIDFGLMADQFGTQKEIATDDKQIITPKFEYFTISDKQTEVTLSQTPINELKQIYIMKPDGSKGQKFEKSASADANTFAFDSTTKKITLPTGLIAGIEILVRYEYASTRAISMSNSAMKYPTAGKFIMEVLGHDVCSPDITIFAWLVMGNAKVSPDVEITFKSDGKHPFTLSCEQQYCDKEKKLFDIIIPEE